MVSISLTLNGTISKLLSAVLLTCSVSEEGEFSFYRVSWCFILQASLRNFRPLLDRVLVERLAPEVVSREQLQ